MASTVLPNGIIIPEKYSRDWYADLYHNWQELDNLLGGGTPKDGTLTIQKNGTTIGTFSANQATDETINIEVPDVNNGTLTIQQNGTAVDTFTANSSSDKTVNIQCVDLTSNQTVAGNKEFTGTTTAHDVIPSATNTYNLGSPSYQWNNAYIKSLTINGVVCGDILTHNASEFASKATTLSGYGITDAYTKTQVDNKISGLVNSAPETLDTLNELASALGNDPNFATTVANQIGTKANDSEVVKLSGNQTIAGIKSFINDIRISKVSPFCNVFSSGYIKGQAPTSNIYSGVRFFDDINSGSTNTITGGFEVEYNRDGYNKSYIASRNYAGENHKFFTVGLRVPNDDTRSVDFLPSVNGIVNLGTSTSKWKSFNGLNPGALSLPSDSYINVDTTNWDVAGGTNVYTPPANGWLHIRVVGATELMVRWSGWRFGDRRVSATATDMGVTIPVVAGVTVDVVTVASGFDGKCQFFPCQGNV